jgi:hypothetical protein
MKSNLKYKNPKKNIKPKRPLTSKNVHKKSPNILASEESKRIYQTQGTYPNSKFLKQLNTDKLEIYLNILNPADVSVISKILPKYSYFQQIILGAFEPKPAQSAIPRTNYYPQKKRSSKSLGKPAKKNKNNIKESDRALFKQKIFNATEKNLINSKNILSLSLLSFKIDVNLSKILSKGILDNKSLQYLSINNCILTVEAFEILLKGVLSHEILRFLDLSNNKLTDNYCPMISRIIQRQAQRRDQIVWSYQLRNELPSDNNYKIGLISLNLHGNYLGSKSAKLISSSLNNDQYIRYIDLSKNLFDNSACKLFVHMMRKNSTLLTVDLRDNLGYDEFINPRIVMKMSKNIKILYSQYQEGEYTEEEFEYLKGFIDISFFDVDIPQEIVQYYNNNIQQTTENKTNDIKQNNIIKKNNSKNKDINKLNDNSKKINNQIEQNNDDINNNEMEQEQEQEIDDIKNNNELNNKINNKNINEINNNNNKAFQKNQKLIEENMKLKQEIMELKAKNFQNESSKEKEKSNEEEKDLENYYNRANEIIDTLNAVMAKLQQHNDKNDNNININEINELIENKKNEILSEENKIINNQNNSEKKEEKENKNLDNDENKINVENNKNKINNKKNIIIKEKKVEDIKDKKEQKEEKENEDNNQIQINNINNDIKINIEKENNISQNEKQKEEIQLINEESSEKKVNNIPEKQEIKNIEDNKKEEKHKHIEENSDKKELNDLEEEEDEGDFNLDNLTEEEKMALIQQREILLKLQEEAEARGEHFDIQEYLAQLAEQSEEDDEIGNQEDQSDKFNKSF